MIAEFEKLVKKVKPSLSQNGTVTVIENGSPTGYYLSKTNNIYLPSWETMPALFKDFGKKVAGGNKEGDELARLFYYGYFLPHEVGHALQFNANKRFDNEYDNEYEANVLSLLRIDQFQLSIFTSPGAGAPLPVSTSDLKLIRKMAHLVLQ